MRNKTKSDRWRHRWYLGAYVVAMDNGGKFGCSCPVWKFKRVECKHILQIKENLFANLLQAKHTEDDGGI